MTWSRDMTDYMLVPSQSKLAIFHDVIRKELLPTNFQEQKCKQTMVVCMMLAVLCSEKPKKQRRNDSDLSFFTSPCLQLYVEGRYGVV